MVSAQSTAPSTASAIRVLLAISHARTRSALRSALEASGRVLVVVEASSVLSLARRAADQRADVVVFDLRLAPPGATPSLADVVASLGEIPLVAVGLEGDPAFARAALRAGASAHVLTDAAPERFLSAVSDAWRS
jgi:two-component system response regulator NreC